MSIHNGDLKAQYKLFAENYLKSGNATQAAKDAGYTDKGARNQGSRLMKREDVQVYLEQLRQPLKEATGQSTTSVVAALTETINRCMQQVPVVNRSGNQVFREDENGIQVPAMVSVDTQGANKALELLGKHFGTFDPNHRSRDERAYFAGIVIQVGPKVVQIKGKWLPEDGPTDPEDIAHIKELEDEYAKQRTEAQLDLEHALLNLEGENWTRATAS